MKKILLLLMVLVLGACVTHADERPIPSWSCIVKASVIREGISRLEVEKLAVYDGGRQHTYKNERMVLKNDPKDTLNDLRTQDQCILDVYFRPANMTIESFNIPERFQAWLDEHGQQKLPTDILVNVLAKIGKEKISWE